MLAQRNRHDLNHTKHGQVNISPCSWELSHKLETEEINNFNLQIVKHDNVDYDDDDGDGDGDDVGGGRFQKKLNP